jgi:hypothetical protein
MQEALLGAYALVGAPSAESRNMGRSRYRPQASSLVHIPRPRGR